MQSVLITKNEKGECVSVQTMKTLNEEQIKAFKKEADEVKAREKQAKLESEKLANDLKEKEQVKRARCLIMLAKQEYNFRVDKGDYEYNGDFEKAYDLFVNGAELKECDMPYEFKKILGGLQ